jgi:hypothetical protein
MRDGPIVSQTAYSIYPEFAEVEDDYSYGAGDNQSLGDRRGFSRTLSGGVSR